MFDRESMESVCSLRQDLGHRRRSDQTAGDDIGREMQNRQATCTPPGVTGSRMWVKTSEKNRSAFCFRNAPSCRLDSRLPGLDLGWTSMAHMMYSQQQMFSKYNSSPAGAVSYRLSTLDSSGRYSLHCGGKRIILMCASLRSVRVAFLNTFNFRGRNSLELRLKRFLSGDTLRLANHCEGTSNKPCEGRLLIFCWSLAEGPASAEEFQLTCKVVEPP